MKWLVCRKEGLRPHETIRNSCFPIIVETLDTLEDYERDVDKFFENIVMRAFSEISENYVGKHEYLVIPMNHARMVSFKPKPSYTVSVERYV